jgi:hypothetical protein
MDFWGFSGGHTYICMTDTPSFFFVLSIVFFLLVQMALPVCSRGSVKDRHRHIETH